MAPETRSPATVSFGVFEVDLRARELRKQGNRIKLQEQPFQALTILLKRPGDVVAREELRSQIWPEDTFVDFDNSLNTAINKLREALGDSADKPRFIETLPRRGYRFLASVSVDHRGKSATAVTKWKNAILIAGLAIVAASAAIGLIWRGHLLSWARPPKIESLAVLPLLNLSGDPQQEYFADGMTDELTTALARIGALRVTSRTSAMEYKGTKKTVPEIAMELNVDAFVEGSVNRSGNRVRVTAQLIEAKTDRHLWASMYERDMRDILALQDEVARAIAAGIQLQLTPQEQSRANASRTVDPRAYELYLRGLEYSRQQGGEPKRTSLDYFKRAIQIDPQWAPPYAQLARSYHWLAGFGSPELYSQAKSAALTAVRLDNGLGEAHAALAYILDNYDWDWAGAEREYHRALELSPNYAEAHYAYALLLTDAGRSDEAVAEIRRAEELDPLFPPLRADVGTIYSCAGRHDEAIEQLRNATELNPDYDVAYTALGFAYLRNSRYQEAVSNLEKALALEKEEHYVYLHRVDLAYAYAAAGRKNEARVMLRKLEKQEATGMDMGEMGLYPVYFALGEKDRGLAWMEGALKKKSASLLHLRCWPEYGRMLAEPRFADLVRRIGIPQ